MSAVAQNSVGDDWYVLLMKGSNEEKMSNIIKA